MRNAGGRQRIMIKKIPHQSKKQSHYGYYQEGKKASPVIAVIILIAIWYLFIGKDLLSQLVGPVRESPYEQTKVYYDFPCSEANLARMIGITLGEGKKEEAVEEALWYETYYNQLESLGITTLKKEEAFNVLSSKKLQEVLAEVVQAKVVIEEAEQLQLYKVLEYYSQIVTDKGKPIEYKNVTILATPTDQEKLSAWEVATDDGRFHFEGLVIDPLKNKKVQIAYIGDELLGVMTIESEESIVADCKIIDVQEKEAIIEIAGLTLNYKQQCLTQDDVGKVGALTIKDNQITAFETDTNQKVDTVVSVDDKQILLENAGALNYKDLSIEDQTGTNRYQAVTDLTYGLKVSYLAQQGRIMRLQVIGNSSLKEIRVLLSDDNGSYIQKEVILKSHQDYDQLNEGKATTLAADKVWKASEFEWDGVGQTIRFVPRNEESQICIESIEKGKAHPQYYGIIEVTKKEEGYQIINEVNLERYVAAVLPSEMPTSYGVEALKAQAIAIRTYGLACMESGRFMNYGAHVDDTTATQVYNRIPPDETAKSVAHQTAGLVLKSDGKWISNKFFATSCGYTANYGEVWAGSEFPSDTPSYLVSRRQYLGEQMTSNLKQEEHFESFIALTAKDLDAFDEDSPWFRWKVNLTREALENLMKPALIELSPKYSKLITYPNEKGSVSSETIEALGNICSLEVLERGEGGNIMNLQITFENGKVQVETEYLIRSLFASNEKQGLSVIRSNDTTVNQMTLLPSAFFAIKQEQGKDGKLTSIQLIGGGNGHGVGLSQDGAKGMAERGYNYKEILQHYYKDCEIVGE